MQHPSEPIPLQTGIPRLNLPPDVILLYKQLLQHVDNLPSNGGFPQNVEWQRQSLRNFLLSKLNGSSPFGDDGDPVLSVAVSEVLGSKAIAEKYTSAFWRLCKEHDVCQLLFGQFLPKALSEHVQAYLSKSKFDQDENASVAEDAIEYMLRLRARKKHIKGFPTGIPTLDDALAGGIHGLTFIAGDKGVGKTLMQLSVCRETLMQDSSTVVLFYSFDMPKTTIIDRLLCRALNLNPRQLQPGGIDESIEQRIECELKNEIYSRLLVITRDFQSTTNESGEKLLAGLTYESILNDVAAFQSLKRILIVIDLFQKMIVPGDQPVSCFDTYRLDVIDQVRSVLGKRIGHDNIGFLVSSEKRKGDTSRGDRLTREDLKGDGRMSSDADCILLMETAKVIDSDTNEIVISVDKGRDGVIRGEHRAILKHRTGAFLDPSVESPSASPLLDARVKDKEFDPYAEE